jgi:hypothetical protein
VEKRTNRLESYIETELDQREQSGLDYELDPLICPRCGGRMKVIAFLTESAVVDRIIRHLKLTFVAERPPPPQVALQELLMAADPPAEYFS